MPTLYDAARCPYCARVRIVLAEKGVAYDPVEIDLDDRPAWIYGLNPSGRVPVLEEDGFVLPESLVVMEYLEERYPEPPLLPADPAARALVRLRLDRFDDDLGDPYYDLLRRRPGGSVERVHESLGRLDELLQAQPYLGGPAYGLADIGYVPWVLRAESRLGLDVRRHGALRAWVERLMERRAIGAEVELVARAA